MHNRFAAPSIDQEEERLYAPINQSLERSVGHEAPRGATLVNPSDPSNGADRIFSPDCMVCKLAISLVFGNLAFS